jgi:UDP-glucose 4-epimerase/UDP-glucuronate decarboxylase
VGQRRLLKEEMSRPDEANKRVLIAGGCGFLGSHLCDELLKRPDVATLVCVDNLWTGHVRNIAQLTDRRFHFVESDIEAFRSDQPFDEVYHLASPASPPWYMREPARTISANVVGALRLLELLKPGGRFCYTSTSEVYGEPLVTPQPESFRGWVDCTGPRSSYDEAKRATEALLFETRRTQGLDLRITRLFNVYGPRTREDDGRAISNFISQALDGKPITVFGDGTQSRSWGYVSDLIEGMARFFWRDTFDYQGPLNLGNDREISVIDIARYVAKLFGGHPIVHAEPAPQDPTNRCPDLTIARQILPGWSCEVPFEEGVERTLEWFRAARLSNADTRAAQV